MAKGIRWGARLCRRPQHPAPRRFNINKGTSVYSIMSATQLSHHFDSFESQQKSSIPAFLHMRMADLVRTNLRRCASC